MGTIFFQVNDAGVVVWQASWENAHAPILFSVRGVGKPFTPTADGAKGMFVDANFDDAEGVDKSIRLAFEKGWGLEGVVVANDHDSAHAAFTLTQSLFQAVLKPASGNGAAGLVEIGVAGSGAASIWVTGLRHGGGGGGGNWKVTLISTANGGGEVAVYELPGASSSGYKELAVPTDGLDALIRGNLMVTVAVAAEGGATVGAGQVRAIPRQFLGLLPDKNGRSSGGNKVGGLAVASLLPNGNVGFTAWVTGLDTPALGNSAVVLGEERAGGGWQCGQTFVRV